MASSIICKLSFGAETRRFTTQTDLITYQTFHERAKQFFGFGDDKFKLQYKDDEGDVITMSTDEEMVEAVALARAATPAVLRISVKLDAPTSENSPSDTKPAASAAPAAEAPDLSSLFKNIGEQLPKMFEPTANGGAAPDVSALLKNIGAQLPAFVDSLPECVKAHVNNAELDAAATMAANSAADIQRAAVAAAAAAMGGGKGPDVSFSVLPPAGLGYGDRDVHPGVTCDKSGMNPIVGPRYNLTGHNYDLCEAEFSKLDAAEQAKFTKIEAPFGRKACGNPNGVHPGVTCDKSGMNPIVGPRFNLRGHNYDLCEAEFSKLDAAEQAKFVRIEPPMPFDPSKCAWKPKCWKNMGGYGPWGGMPGGWGNPMGGMGGGHCGGNMGGGGGGHCGGNKYAARFVRDVAIFDGTQMAPGTTFTKIWRIKNAGETAWPQGTKLLFVGGDRMAAELMVPVNESGKAVNPGEEVDVAVDMVAPTELGRYLGYWRLVGPFGRRRFGQRVWCHIQVVDPTASDAPHDPNAVAAEISNLMAKAQKDDPDADDGENDGAAAASSAAAVAASSDSVAGLSSAVSSAVAGLSSTVSSATSSAVSVRKEDIEPIEPLVTKQATPVVKEAPVEAAAVKEAPVEAAAVKEAPVEPSPVTSKSVEVEAAEPKDEADVATQLLQMGFDAKSVELIVDKNSGKYPLSGMVEACARDLVQLSEWDEMLSDLEEMGFENRDLNTRLMVKHNGSVKRTVKDLVADAM